MCYTFNKGVFYGQIADVSPMIGMLMLPKTCMYIWAVMMGYKTVNQKN
ncbi:MAG: hypothetical protein MJ182_03955 [Treponema sp.]|nr:hypothetical protein [Treponema sp.]